MNIEEVYAGFNHWLKDLDFLDMERRFLKKIIKDYISGSGLISRKIVTDFEERLTQLGMDIHSLRTDIISTQTRIELIIKDEIEHSWNEIQDQQTILHSRYDELFSAFHRFKMELYQVAAQIMEEEAMD